MASDNVKAVYPGTFDPPTLGHIDIIERVLKVFGKATVLVARSSKKTALFSEEERLQLLRESTSHLTGLNIEIHSGLTVDFMTKSKSQVIIRGLRAVSDFEYELQMAMMNKKLGPNVETFIVMTSEKFYSISSNMVKEVAAHGGDLSQLVPQPVVAALKSKLKN